MPDQVEQALATALEMRIALSELNQQLFEPKGFTLGLGIGIHTGMVVAGNFGSPERYNYTVIGDDVNVASRLQALTRNPEYDTDIIVSDASLRESTTQFQTRMLGEVSVKGKQQPVLIHALLGRA
jgi:adenylate cyclase